MSESTEASEKVVAHAIVLSTLMELLIDKGLVEPGEVKNRLDSWVVMAGNRREIVSNLRMIAGSAGVQLEDVKK